MTSAYRSRNGFPITVTLIIVVAGVLALWGLGYLIGRAMDIQYVQRCQVYNNCDQHFQETGR